MDDYSLESLNESKNEWCARLLNVLTPHFISGVQSIYKESVSTCKINREMDKYLLTFQNYLSRIPHWNNTIIVNERERIIEASQCDYIEDLVTCIHVIQLKILSCMRVSHENKKMDIKIPEIDAFIHSVYINIAKVMYKNVYLFEENVPPLTRQRNNRSIEIIVRECIINTVRDSIPVAHLIRMFLDLSEEHDKEFVKETTITEDVADPEEGKEEVISGALEMPTESSDSRSHGQTEEGPMEPERDAAKEDDAFGRNVVKEDDAFGRDAVKEDDAFGRLDDLSYPRSSEGGDSSRTIKFSNAITEVYPDGSTHNSSIGDLIHVNLDETDFDAGDTIKLKAEPVPLDDDLDVIEL